MQTLTEIEVREAFHCHLIAQLPELYRAPASGVAPLRLKGGVNLRLFHASPRYSEDIDFDLVPERGPTFVGHLQKVLDTPPLRRALLPLGITNIESSPLDSGDRGFKLKLRVTHGGVLHHTKIEVSYREETAAAEAEVKPLPAALQTRYGNVRAIALAAYPGSVAIWQKALALSRRGEPQTRDAFDLAHLVRTQNGVHAAGGAALIRQRMNGEAIRAAIDVVEGFDDKMFTQQTAAYLPAAMRGDAIKRWRETQTAAWAWLQGLTEAPAPKEAL